MTAYAESVLLLRRAAQPVRVAAGQVFGMIGYLAIFASALSGYTGLGVWAVGGAAVALASLSYAEHSGLYRRGQEMGLTEITQSTLLQSLANALLAAGGAYIVGLVFRLI